LFESILLVYSKRFDVTAMDTEDNKNFMTNDVFTRDGHEIRISELSEYPDIQIRI